MTANLVVALSVLVVTGLLLKLMSEYRQDENRLLSERLERLEAENARLRQENRVLHIRLGDPVPNSTSESDTPSFRF